MTDALAVSKLFADVSADLAEHAITANVVFGWRELAKQVNQGPGQANRVVFVPGTVPDGDMGKDLPARNPGRVPRPIATVAEIVTIEVWGYDASAPENELKQYEAARFLYDAVRAAVYRSSHGTYTIEGQNWVTEKTERRFGAAIRIELAIQAMIPDAPPSWVYAPQPITATSEDVIALPGGDEIACQT